nr:hypothetical protein [Tanacetum cinerariifolium]
VLLERLRHRREATGRPRILCKNLNGEAVETFRATIFERLAVEDMSASNVDQMWNTLACVMKDAAKDSLGVASARTHSTHRESWWFCEEGVNEIYKIAKARERRRRDIGNVKYIKDEGGRTIVREEDIRTRWREYFSSLFNETPFEESRPKGSGEVGRSSSPAYFDCYYSRINHGEVRAALQKMGRNKVVGPDQIPIEAWRCLGDEGVKWLTCIFNKIFSSAKMPDEWRLSEVIPVYKNKGDARACSNYRDKGTPRRYSRVIKDMYEGEKTRVRTTAGNAEYFLANLGLHHGSAISPYLFSLILDELSNGIQENIPWCMIFADYIVMIAESAEKLNNRLESWRKTLEDNGLRILQPKESFRYLGSVLHRSGRIVDDVAHRIIAGWINWRAASGVLCDKRIPLKLNGKFYKAAIRPAMLYGSECWPIMKALAFRVEVAELRMLRWTCGKTMVDMISNGVFRAALDVDSIIDKIREGMLRWFGHVNRRPQSAPVRRVEVMVVEGSRIRGRPKLRWKDRLKMDTKELRLSKDMTSNRNAWRERIRISRCGCVLVCLFFLGLLCAYSCMPVCWHLVCLPWVYDDVGWLLALVLFYAFPLSISLMHTYAGRRSPGSSLFTFGFILKVEVGYVYISPPPYPALAGLGSLFAPSTIYSTRIKGHGFDSRLMLTSVGALLDKKTCQSYSF